ncbi:LAMI_0D06898g1_1 [Lachancea mirantina]|uniref:LAMI_0D06898g1_1 n=1 Tax=Lachancea mirantina TaxID=1230905 RepID=A0A1G4JC20_9SACH|nr:LAMI_0D06898g1_1 [Lachancea mirantina]
MSHPAANRKRTRPFEGPVFLDNNSDSLVDEILARQTDLLQGNLLDPGFGRDTASSAAGAGAFNGGPAGPRLLPEADQFEDEEDDDVIFLKEQPVGFDAPNYNDSYYTAKKFKKQRTVSLPQLPHAKLLYETRKAFPRRQNDDDLLHLSGSSTRTIDGNRSVMLKVIRSVSPTSRISSEATPVESTIFKRATAAPKLSKLVSGRKRKKEFFVTDKEGHYVYQENDVFSNGRFIVKRLLGQGTFGKVVKCIDSMPQLCTMDSYQQFEDPFAESYQDFGSGASMNDAGAQQQGKFVAVKIIRAVDRYREAAKTELRVLKTILENDPSGTFQCLLLRECFDYKNHICLITDLLGKSIYDFMCDNGCARFPGSQVQAISKQLIRSVCFLHDLGIIHTDLKPENILLCDESYVSKPLSQQAIASLSPRRRTASGGERKFLTNPEVKLIDFGSAVFYNEFHPAVISTRHYRAPEIVLGLGWSFPCDVWSIGCVLVELVTGESLYPIHENLEHMAMMQRFSGKPFPTKIIEKMFYKAERKLGNLPPDLNATVVKHFDKETCALKWPERNRKGDIVTKEKSMRRVLTTCDRLDKYICQKIRQDYGEWLSINWDMSAEDNWVSIESRFSDKELDRETFLFWYWFLDLCKKMFEFDPTKRITAREAIEHEWFNFGILDEGIASFGKV